MKHIVAGLVFLLLSNAAWGEPLVGRSDLYIPRNVPDVEEQRASGFQIRDDLEPWPLVFPVDWNANPFHEDNWRFQLNAWRMTDTLLAAYFRTEDASYLREAMTFVEDWHDFHMVRGRTSEYGWYDMATGIRALRIAFFIDAGRTGILNLTGDQVRVLGELADEHAIRLQDESFIAINNHGLFQVAGLNLLCTVASDRPACADGRAFAERKFQEIIASQFTEEGVHTENSPSYHFFVRNILSSLGALQSIEWGETNLDEINAVRSWLVFPDETIAAVGDSSGMARGLPPVEAVPACLSDERCFAVGDFTKSGYAIVRSMPGEADASMLFVAGSAHSPSHKHADDLSFELFEFGRFIFIDGGKYGYKRDDFRRYVESADAHNTIGLDGVRVSSRDVEYAGSLLNHPIEITESGFRIQGKVTRPRLFTQERTISYVPGRSLHITDRLDAPWSIWRSARYQSSLLLAPDLEPILAEDGFTVTIGDKSLAARLIEDDCEISVSRGETDPHRGWQSIGYQKMTPASVVRAVCPGRNRTISWDIQFN